MGRISTGIVFNLRRCSCCLDDQSETEQKALRRCSDCVYSFCQREICGWSAVEHRRSGMCSELKQIADDERYVRFAFFPFFLASLVSVELQLTRFENSRPSFTVP